MTKKNFLDDYISGIFNNDNLVSMRDGRTALVFGKYAQHGYIIISPCSSMNDADAIPHIRTMIDSIQQTKYSYMPVYARFIKDADIYHEEHVYVKAIVIFNYNHGHDWKTGCQIKRPGTAETLKNLLDFGIELAKQFHQREFLYKAPHQQLQAIDQNGNLIDKSCLEDIIDGGRLVTSYFAKLYNHMLGGEPPEFTQSRNFIQFYKILSSFAGCYANPAPFGISERRCRIAHKEIFIK